MRLKDAESKIVNQIWVYITLMTLVWLAIVGFVGYRLRSSIIEVPLIPVSSKLPQIDTAKIIKVEEALASRSAQVLPPPPATEFRSEPFD